MSRRSLLRLRGHAAVSSGKLLKNRLGGETNSAPVVGGDVGVFEGNGGDLCIASGWR